MMKATSNTLEEKIVAKESVLLNFYSENCGACKMLAFILEDVRESSDQPLDIVEINYQEHEELIETFQVTGYPTLIHLKNGQEVSRREGLVQKTGIIKMIEEQR